MVLPLFHIFGLSFIMLLAVATGAQVVMHIRFDPDRVLADIARKKITAFPAVPTMYTALVNHPKVKEFDLSSVAMWSSGGAPLPMEVLQRFKGLTGHSPREGYGLTETAPLGTMQVTDGPARPAPSGCRRRTPSSRWSTSRPARRCCPSARGARSASAGRR